MIQISLPHQIKHSLVDSMGWDKMLIGSLFGSPIPRTGLWFGWPTETDLPMAEVQEFLYDETVQWS
jgi:hypothetical protein